MKKAPRDEVFDICRKKYVALTPEEWVRQHLVHFLINEKKVPSTLIAVEQSLNLHNVTKRSDIVIYNNSGVPLMMIECKSPDVKISQDTFDQIIRYNFALKVKYLMVSNGLQHFCCVINYDTQSYEYLEEIPDYSVMRSSN